MVIFLKLILVESILKDYVDYIIFLDDGLRQDLRFIKIKFVAPVFTKVTKERATTFVNMLSEIGGTMGLLTGFSIITAVEIVYFAIKIIFGFLNGFRTKKTKNSTEPKIA